MCAHDRVRNPGTFVSRLAGTCQAHWAANAGQVREEVVHACVACSFGMLLRT